MRNINSKPKSNVKIVRSPSSVSGFAESGYTKNGTKRLVSGDCTLYIPNFHTAPKYFEHDHKADVIELFSKRKVA